MTHQPPGTFHPPNQADVVADLRRRTKALEQRPQFDPTSPRFGVSVGNPAPVELGSPRQTGRLWPWRGAWHLESIILDGQGVGSGTVEVRRSGLTIPNGSLTVLEGTQRLGFDETWAISDYLDLTIDGDVDVVTMQLWFRGSEPSWHLNFIIPAGGGA